MQIIVAAQNRWAGIVRRGRPRVCPRMVGPTLMRSNKLFLAVTALWALLLTPLTSRAIERIIVSDINGARIAPLDTGRRKATVLIFITNDCPIANACAPEIERIYRAYAPKQVRMYLVYVDASLTVAAASAHHKAYAYTCPAVLDPDHRLVRAGRARVTTLIGRGVSASNPIVLGNQSQAEPPRNCSLWSATFGARFT